MCAHVLCFAPAPRQTSSTLTCHDTLHPWGSAGAALRGPAGGCFPQEETEPGPNVVLLFTLESPEDEDAGQLLGSPYLSGK